jgi:hypothetical protein
MSATAYFETDVAPLDLVECEAANRLESLGENGKTIAGIDRDTAF